MKKLTLSIIGFSFFLATMGTGFAQSNKMQSINKNNKSQPNRPQIEQSKVKEAREYCMKEHKITMPKKGEKPNSDNIAKFRSCMREKLAPEIKKMRQQKRK